MYALNPDGTLKWSFQTGASVCSSPAIDGAGNIYFNSHDENYYSLSPNGLLRWSYDTGNLQGSAPTISSDGTVYFFNHDYWITSLMAFGPGE